MVTEKEILVWNTIARNQDLQWNIAGKTDGPAHEGPPPKPEGPKDEKGHPIFPSNQKRYWKELRKKPRNRRPIDPTWP